MSSLPCIFYPYRMFVRSFVRLNTRQGVEGSKRQLATGEVNELSFTPDCQFFFLFLYDMKSSDRGGEGVR
jgi:hypothetical protein